jgi:N-acetylglucosamine-6-sulfatase
MEIPTGPGSWRARALLAVPFLLLIATVLIPAGGLTAEAGERAATPPNIVLILTDDQRWDSLRYMPHVRADLMSRGMTFANAFVSNPLCCPSRSTILTGNYSHTTGVYTNVLPSGGWAAFHDGGAEASTIATWLHDAGYHTSLLGKYLNHYGPNNTFVPPGWDHWAAFEEESPYYDYTLNVDGSFVSYGQRAADYSTDVLADYAVQDIEQVPADQPLFLYLAPSAPHGPATAAPRDLGTVSAGGFVNHLPPSFNERDMRDKPGYLRRLPLVGTDKESRRFVKTVETLGAVDDAIHEVVGALRSTGRLDNTLIAFASDNGIGFGEHRWTYKLVPYEESIRIPLVMRWDAVVSPGVLDRHLVANVDFAPTFSEAAGVVPPAVEGRSLVPLLRGEDPRWRGLFLLEHLWYSRGDRPNPPTYCGVRNRNRLFVHYASGFEEYYNLRLDPYELRNAIDRASQGAITHVRDATRRLCDPLPPGMPPF